MPLLRTAPTSQTPVKSVLDTTTGKQQNLDPAIKAKILPGRIPGEYYIRFPKANDVRVVNVGFKDNPLINEKNGIDSVDIPNWNGTNKPVILDLTKPTLEQAIKDPSKAAPSISPTEVHNSGDTVPKVDQKLLEQLNEFMKKYQQDLEKQLPKGGQSA